jgi:Homeodomain-like domain
MVAILSAVVSIFAFRFRGRASLELELVALRHQVTVLRRQRPGRPQLSSLDRLLWVWLYRIWPQVIDAMVLVKPATVVQWHRKGFRLFWRGRSRRPGRPKIGTEVRALIRRMSKANPLWGAPRIHGELRKLGIKISQATVGRWMPWRPKVPSPTWRSFLRNHLPDIAAIDMFVVATATFRLLYALIVLSLDRRRVVRFEVTQNPTQDWLSGQMTEAFPWDTAPRYLLRDRDKSYGPAFRHRVRAMGIRRSLLPRDHPGRIHMPSVSSVRSAVNAWITLSSSTSGICAASCRAIFNIIITPEPISRSTRTALGLVACNFPPQATLLPSRRWAVSIIAMSVEPRNIGEATRYLSLPSITPN